MPKARAANKLPCAHSALFLESSKHAAEVGYSQPTPQKRQAATQPSGRVSKKSTASIPGPSTFPPPLILPGDELARNPSGAPQSFRSWAQTPTRNQPDAARRTIYVVPPPNIDDSVPFLTDALTPLVCPGASTGLSSSDETAPTCEFGGLQQNAIVDFLRAFYHPLPVEVLTSPRPTFTLWRDRTRRSQPSEKTPIALSIGKGQIHVHHRPSPDSIFSSQLNLNDMLEAALAILPSDAHSLIMLTHHDIYEDEDDDFCCGRAYGGSRISIVSTARYSPSLDQVAGIDKAHAWPASHCADFVANNSGCAPPRPRKRAKLTSKPTDHDTNEPPPTITSPMQAALSTIQTTPPSPSTPTSTSSALTTLWLSRVCKTASHELGHCFGLDHCTYYACVMQGTAGLGEDSRQPPYLCPVDLAKLLRATGGGAVELSLIHI